MQPIDWLVCLDYNGPELHNLTAGIILRDLSPSKILSSVLIYCVSSEQQKISLLTKQL